MQLKHFSDADEIASTLCANRSSSRRISNGVCAAEPWLSSVVYLDDLAVDLVRAAVAALRALPMTKLESTASAHSLSGITRSSALKQPSVALLKHLRRNRPNST